MISAKTQLYKCNFFIRPTSWTLTERWWVKIYNKKEKLFVCFKAFEIYPM
ncbi:hypothetical protein [Neochlamydia sp. AcF84]|nr:hypothetical protein [Neochlamydia sp. AcF84]